MNGMPFRQAHGVVGGLVADSLASGTPLLDLVRAHPELGEAGAALLAPGVAVQNRTTPGGAGPAVIGAQLANLRTTLDDEIRRLSQVGG